MPIDYRINVSTRVVYGRAWGIITDQDLSDNRDALFRDAAFAPDLAQLYDCTGVTEIKVTSAALLDVSLTSRFAPTARRAIVVSSDVVFGVARMYAQLIGREEIQVFRDHPSALHWLESPRR